LLDLVIGLVNAPAPHRGLGVKERERLNSRGFFAGTTEHVEAAFESFFNGRLDELQRLFLTMVNVSVVE